jgi:hypothetical protein
MKTTCDCPASTWTASASPTTKIGTTVPLRRIPITLPASSTTGEPESPDFEKALPVTVIVGWSTVPPTLTVSLVPAKWPATSAGVLSSMTSLCRAMSSW